MKFVGAFLLLLVLLESGCPAAHLGQQSSRRFIEEGLYTDSSFQTPVARGSELVVDDVPLVRVSDGYFDLYYYENGNTTMSPEDFRVRPATVNKGEPGRDWGAMNRLASHVEKIGKDGDGLKWKVTFVFDGTLAKTVANQRDLSIGMMEVGYDYKFFRLTGVD